MRRKLAILITAILAASALTGCGGGGNQTAANPTQAPTTADTPTKAPEGDSTEAADATPAASGDVVEIEFMNMDQAWKPVDFGADPVTKVFMEKTGVKMKCVAPQGDADQIANVMLVSGDYPEMMHMGCNATMDKYIAAGAILPIDELAKQYDHPNVMNGTYIPQDVIRVRSKSDGHLYIAPNWFSTDGFGSVGTAVNVRNDIYEELGKPEFTTIDDLYNFLVKAKEKNYTSPDGVPMVPLAFNNVDKQYIGYIANLWGSKIYNYCYYNETTKRVEFMLRSDTVLKAVQFLSKCLKDGLISPEVLTYDSTQRTEANNQGKFVVNMCELWDLWTPNSALSQVDPKVYYVSVPPPAGTPGVQQYFGRIHKTGGSGTMITKNCKNPEAAIRFVDYFLSPEGQILNFYGVEGQTMEYVDGKPKLFDEAYEGKLADWEGYAKSHGIRIFDFMNNASYNWERDQESPARQADRKIATDYAFDGSIIMSMLLDPTSDAGILYSEIEAGITSEMTKMILEPDPEKITKMMSDLMAEYERKGITKLEDEWTKQYTSKL